MQFIVYLKSPHCWHMSMKWVSNFYFLKVVCYLMFELCVVWQDVFLNSSIVDK